MADQLVSWQTAFWALPPIAINTMLQPSGRVCGFHPELRTYLCCSPLICAFDSVAIVVRFIASWIVSGSPSTAIRATLRARFPEPSPDTITESAGLQALESATFVRWTLGFFIGALPQYIKLCALTGVPWTKAWATMYVVNFALIEALTFCDYCLGRQTTPEPLELPEIPVFERLCGILALACHFVLGVWTMPSITDGFKQLQWNEEVGKGDSRVGTLVFVSLLLISIDYLWKITLITPKLFAGVTVRFQTVLFSNSFLYFALSGVVAFSLKLQSATKDISEISTGWSRAYDWITAASFLLVAVNSIALLACIPPYRPWKTSVLLIPAEETGIGHKRERHAEYNFSMFLVSLGLTVFWYAFCFESEGTYKPAWTNVFG